MHSRQYFAQVRVQRTPSTTFGGARRSILAIDGELSFAGRDTLLGAAEADGTRPVLADQLVAAAAPVAVGWRRVSVVGEVVGLRFRYTVEDVEDTSAAR